MSADSVEAKRLITKLRDGPVNAVATRNTLFKYTCCAGENHLKEVECPDCGHCFDHCHGGKPACFKEHN